jgi:diguanylate cyclase (GGDEF)-like protein
MKSYFEQDLCSLSKDRLIKMIYYYKYDDLTGLPGRKDFEREFHEIFNHYKAKNKTFYLGFVDVNGLHEVNRNEGYYAGDNLIKRVASCLTYSCNGDIYRSSGDEFFIISKTDNSKNCKTHEDYVFAQVSNEGFRTSSEMFDFLDKKLIEAKKEYYKQTGKDRRN